MRAHRPERRATPARRLLLLLVIGAACGEPDLEVRGSQDRVVGETVTLALVEGEQTFSGELSLRAADNVVLNASALQIGKKESRSLEFVIPAGIAAGEAVALAGRGGGGTFEVPLHVNRLAVIFDEKASIETWPLAPASVARASLASKTGALVALSSTGGELALADDSQVRLLALGATIKDVGAAVAQTGVSSLAAGSGGRVLVATADSIILFRFTKGQQTTQEAITFKDVRSVAVSAAGTLGVVLFGCTSTEGAKPTTCLQQLSLTPSLSVNAETRVELDTAPDAKVVAFSRDGNAAVAADGNAIHGAYFGTTPPKRTMVAWRFDQVAYAATPVGLDRASGLVQGESVDLFAVAESTKGLLNIVTFNPRSDHNLDLITTVQLPGTPRALSFGRQTQLFVASERKLFALDAGWATPTPVEVLEVTPANAISRLLVQP